MAFFVFNYFMQIINYINKIEWIKKAIFASKLTL
jgi:hypothetical protein